MTARDQILANIRRSTTPPRPLRPGAPVSHQLHPCAGPAHPPARRPPPRLRRRRLLRATPAELPGLIGRILTERGKTNIAIPAGFPAAYLPPTQTFTEDTRRGIAQVDACQGVLTTATLAIALTGTIVLQDAPGQGRRAVTLLPDYHLCLVNIADIVETVPEAMTLLAPTARLATTFFSGPSATADIEMTRIKGVHGPRFVDVILVASGKVSQAPSQRSSPEKDSRSGAYALEGATDRAAIKSHEVTAPRAGLRRRPRRPVRQESSYGSSATSIVAPIASFPLTLGVPIPSSGQAIASVGSSQRTQRSPCG